MGTRTALVFITPPEYAEALSDILQRGRICCVALCRDSRPQYTSVEPSACPQAVQDKNVSRLFLGEGPIDVSRTEPGSFSAVKLGLVDIGKPLIENGTLFLCQIGVKTDYYDSQTGTVVEVGRRPINLFDSVKRRFLAETTSPVWVGSTVTGKWRPEHRIHYSSGAVDFERRGGQLKQRGAENVLFSCLRPTST